MADRNHISHSLDGPHWGPGDKRGKRGSAGMRPGDPVRTDAGPRPADPDAREARVRRDVLAAVRAVLPLSDLPCLLWLVGVARPQALWRLEELGQEVADAMGDEGGTLEGALTRWTDALAHAHRKLMGSQAPATRRPVWAFWTLFTRAGELESPLTALLREEVGYPDAEAGIPIPIEQVLTLKQGDGQARPGVASKPSGPSTNCPRRSR